MMYYNNISATINPNPIDYDTLKEFRKWFDSSSQRRSEVKPIEYAFKDEVDYLKCEVNRHNTDIDHCLQAIDVNRKDCEQMYQSIDMLKTDMQQVKQVVNYLCDRAESAPSVTKRKRKVTICANGQRVEIRRS